MNVEIIETERNKPNNIIGKDSLASIQCDITNLVVFSNLYLNSTSLVSSFVITLQYVYFQF